MVQRGYMHHLEVVQTPMKRLLTLGTHLYNDPYAYRFDEKSEVRDKLLMDWAKIRLTKMAEMSIFWIRHITTYARVLC